ncbi:trans-sialidase [Trypanosoma cruzi]|nr:trans-sialidase [Trypanosoma cruzi]
MIIYSTDYGSAWSLSEDMSSAECLYPRVTGWKESLLMSVDCENGERVQESRDMGTAWTEAIGTLSAVCVNARSGVSQKESLRVDALITATIEERKVMLCTHRGHASGKKGPLRSAFGSRTTTARFLLDWLPWKMLQSGRQN